MAEYKSVSGSAAEDLFIDLFADTFGAEKPLVDYWTSESSSDERAGNH